MSELGVVERGKRRFAGRGARRRQSPPDTGREANGLATVMSREVRHLEAVEDGELDRLLRAGLEVATRLVELLDLVDRGEVGTPELGQAAAQREAGPDAADQARIGESTADVGDRRLRQPEAAGDLARSRGFAVVVREDVEDRRCSGDRGGERTAASRVPLSSLSLAICKPLVSQLSPYWTCGQYGGCRTAY